MGEAKRRKVLDPNFGLPKVFSTEIDGLTLKVEPRIYRGCLTFFGKTEYQLEVNATNDEINFIEQILNNTLDYFLEKYDYARIDYNFKFDVSNIVVENYATLKITPRFWDYSHPQIRSSREIRIELEPILENDKPKLDRVSPIEHIRKAHKRRVAYGKDRSLRKWIDIPETIVNAK